MTHGSVKFHWSHKAFTLACVLWHDTHIIVVQGYAAAAAAVVVAVVVAYCLPVDKSMWLTGGDVMCVKQQWTGR